MVSPFSPLAATEVDQLFNSTDKRLARILLLMSGFDKQATFHELVSRVSHETLAAMVGATRPRVSFL